MPLVSRALRVLVPAAFFLTATASLGDGLKVFTLTEPSGRKTPIPFTEKVWLREQSAIGRKGPDETSPAQYLIQASGDTPITAVSAAGNRAGANSPGGFWVELDLGQGRTAFVDADQLLTEQGRIRVQALRATAAAFRGKVEDAIKHSKGPFAPYAGLYDMARRCGPRYAHLTPSDHLFF